MKFERFSFGSISIDGMTYEKDVVIDRGEVRKRKKKASQKSPDEFGHTPLSIDEEIAWNCHTLVIGTGTGALPIMVREEAKRRHIRLLVSPTAEAIEQLKENSAPVLLSDAVRRGRAEHRPGGGPRQRRMSPRALGEATSSKATIHSPPSAVADYGSTRVEGPKTPVPTSPKTVTIKSDFETPEEVNLGN